MVMVRRTVVLRTCGVFAPVLFGPLGDYEHLDSYIHTPTPAGPGHLNTKGEKMSDTEVLDKTFHFILKRMVDTGQAPHYTEIAAELGVSPEDGRKTMHTLFESGIYGWLFPNTNFIASFAPFNNQPTQFRVSVEGEQKWFAQ